MAVGGAAAHLGGMGPGSDPVLVRAEEAVLRQPAGRSDEPGSAETHLATPSGDCFTAATVRVATGVGGPAASERHVPCLRSHVRCGVFFSAPPQGEGNGGSESGQEGRLPPLLCGWWPEVVIAPPYS